MAKQRGVVQLSGRVDNLCYYQQKRVRGGLVRRINLAMGERVKVGAEYQSLRTANSYFGGCSMCAAAILSMTGTRAQFLHYPNRQAILTKTIFDFQSRFSAYRDYDNIVFDQNTGLNFSEYYDRIVKNKMSKFLPSVPSRIIANDVNVPVSVIIPKHELETFCAYNKCIGISFLVTYDCYLYPSNKDTLTNKFVYPDFGSNNIRQPFIWQVGDDNLTISFDSGSYDDAFSFAFLSALPLVRLAGGRPVTKDTGASTKLIGIVYQFE